MDALQCLAHIRILRKRDSEGKAILKQVVDKTMQIAAKEKQEQSLGNLIAAQENKAAQKVDVQEIPSIQFRMQTVRLCTEV